MRPLIGISCSEIRRRESVRQTPEGEPPREELGLGLTYVRAVERAGVIEGIELPDHPFAVGVQWHAECLVDRDEHLRLFEGLTDAARDFSESGRGGLRAA